MDEKDILTERLRILQGTLMTFDERVRALVTEGESGIVAEVNGILLTIMHSVEAKIGLSCDLRKGDACSCSYLRRRLKGYNEKLGGLIFEFFEE